MKKTKMMIYIILSTMFFALRCEERRGGKDLAYMIR